MTKIMIISKDRHFSSRLASPLRTMGYRVLIEDNFFDGMRELLWSDVRLIIYEVDYKDPIELKSCLKMRNRYKKMATIAFLKNHEALQDVDLESDVILSQETAAEIITTEVEKLIGPPPVFYADDYSTPPNAALDLG
jgi:hypothetical protein